jgi:hypothetical protein
MRCLFERSVGPAVTNPMQRHVQAGQTVTRFDCDAAAWCRQVTATSQDLADIGVNEVAVATSWAPCRDRRLPNV